MRTFFEIFNFDNIGGKIKAFTKWSCWISILLVWICSAISFGLLLFSGAILLALAVLVGAVLSALGIWVGSWLLYALGEFVEDTSIIRQSAEVKARREADDRAIHEAEERLRRKREAEAKREEQAKREAEIKHEEELINAAEESKEVETEIVPEPQPAKKETVQKPEKTLKEKLEYALMFESDDGMIGYLKYVQNESVQDILKLPKHTVRDNIKELLSGM